MKILQLNIWGGKLGKKINELLIKEDADVLCLQEVIQMVEGKPFWLFNDLSSLLKNTEYKYISFAPNIGFNVLHSKAQGGMAIISKTPFLHENNFFTIGEYDDDFNPVTSNYNIRSLQHVKIKCDDQEINILNHHGHHVSDHKEGNEETMRQCKIISEYIQNLSGSVVFCGDMNLHPTSDSLEQINKILVNHALEENIKTTRNELTEKNEVCDYIFTSKDLDVENFTVLNEVVSDHSALTIEVKKF